MANTNAVENSKQAEFKAGYNKPVGYEKFAGYDKQAQQQAKQPFKYTMLLLYGLFLAVVLIRIYFAFQTPYFSGEDSYFTIRQSEHIAENYVPFYEDSLSFGGRSIVFSPFYYYFISFFNLFMPIEFVGKIVLNIFAASLIIIIFYITKEITNDERASLFSAFVGAFIPIFFSSTVNTFSINSLIFPLFFLMVFFYFRIEKAYSAVIFMIIFFILCLSHPIGVLFLLSWVLYLILIKLENFPVAGEELEIGTFSVFLFVWTHLIIYKNALFSHGLSIIWQNIPDNLIHLYFQQINLVSAIYYIGVTSLLYGVYAIFQHVFYHKDKKTYFLVSITIATFFLLWLRLISIELGLITIGIVMSILFSKFYTHTFKYINKTKFSRYSTVLWIGFFIVLFLSSVVPSIYFTNSALAQAPSQKEMEAFQWIGKNTKENEIILTPPQEGNLITAVSKRKNVLDTNYVLVDNINEIFEDTSEVYYTTYETKAIETLNNYGVDYLFISKRIKERLKAKLDFLDDKKCFEQVFKNDEVGVFKTLCKLK